MKNNENENKNTIYGRNVILELLQLEECNIEEIFIQIGIEKNFLDEIIKKAKNKNIKITQLDKQKFQLISSEQKTQGILAKVASYKYSSLDEIINFAKEKKEDPFLLILDKIEDPHNLGAIVRSAEAFGVHGIVLPERRCAHINASVYKSSAGAVSHIKICIENNLNNTIDFLKKNNFWIYGSDAGASDFSSSYDYKGAIALIIGNEGKGISRLTKEKCDILIKIPIYGKTESLNASVAAGILMYDVIKKRNN